MGTIAMAFLAASVALGYFTIAAVVAPRIKMPSASRQVVVAIRGAAIAFFVGCGMTHVHIFIHTLGVGTPQPVEAHELVFHSMQAVGAWLFIAGAILRLELHVVPSRTRVQLQAAVEEQRWLADQAQKVAGQDELTGLARRWRFDEEIERHVAVARRYGTPGALVLIDVDGLKSVNDTLGHQAGDDVLRHVAGSIRTQLRATDIAARIGGDEFAVILPETGTHEAQAVAQRFVASLHDTSVDGTLRTSVSAGVASIEGLLSPADVMKRADIALYRAKRAGGDRYAMSEPVPQPQSA
jgi:diguanylate cyclase (GGDEF)-like protein